MFWISLFVSSEIVSRSAKIFDKLPSIKAPELKYFSTASALRKLSRASPKSPISKRKERFCRLKELVESDKLFFIWDNEQRGRAGSFGVLKESRIFILAVRSTGSQRLVAPNILVKPLLRAISSMALPIIASPKFKK